MTKAKSKKRIDYLCKRVQNMDVEYYQEFRCISTDQEYDKLYEELVELEGNHPEYLNSWSPTQRVGDDRLDGFEKKPHREPVLSLNKIYTMDKFKLPKGDGDWGGWVVEPKVDGVCITVRYAKGVLIEALTRGNGLIGDDVTQNVRAIKSIPLRLNHAIDITVRGDVYIPKVYGGNRNAAAGALKLLDTKESVKRGLNCVFYDVMTPEWRREYGDQFKICLNLRDLGFKTVGSSAVFGVTRLKAQIDTIQVDGDLDFEIDGVVIKVIQVPLQESLGCTQKAPRWAVAYKFPNLSQTTILRDIVWTTGAKGKITPVGHFDPIMFGTTKVQRATLHNRNYIDKGGFKIGSKILVERAGGVIPKIVKVTE